MGATEEAGKAVGGFFDALKAQPLSLALVVMNIALLAIFWLITTNQTEYREKELKLMFDSQREVQQLLSRCVVPK